MIRLFACLALLGGPQDPVTPPALTRIVIQPDTVWFTGEEPRDTKSYSPVYGLVRRSGQWIRVAHRSFPPLPKLVPQSSSDTVPLVPGFALVLQQRQLSTDSMTSQLGIAAMAAHRFYPLTPILKREEAERLRSPEGLWYGTKMDARTADLPLGGPTGVWATDGNAVWFGLAGGFSEGYGGVGGLLRFDVRGRAVESIWHEQLLQVAVTSMSIAGGSLWIGTVHHGEYGPGGWVGLLRYDLRSRGWLRYQADSTPLPGNVVWKTATDGHRLWISTDKGLAELHLRTGRWRVAYYEPVLRGDSIVHELAVSRPSSVIGKTIALTHRLAPRRRAEFLEAIRRFPPQRFACEIDYQECQLGIVAAPELRPFLLEALDGAGSDLAARALQHLGDRGAVPALRRALGTAAPIRAATIAVVLAQMGDTAGPAWVHRELQRRPPRGSLGFAMSAAGEIRDSANIPTLIELLGFDGEGQLAMATLARYSSREIWLKVAETVLADPKRAQYFLPGLRGYGAPLGDPEFDRLHSRILMQALRSPDSWLQSLAARQLLERRDTLGIPHLIRLLTDTRGATRDNIFALVEATGVDSLLVSPSLDWNSDSTEIHKAQGVWATWWEQSRSRFRFATKEEGQAALDRWRGRWPEEDE